MVCLDRGSLWDTVHEQVLVLVRRANRDLGCLLLCGMGVCFECIVTVNGEPNIRSCMTEVEDNLRVEINE